MQAEDKAAVVARAGVVVVGVAALIYGIYLLRNLLAMGSESVRQPVCWPLPLHWSPKAARLAPEEM